MSSKPEEILESTANGFDLLARTQRLEDALNQVFPEITADDRQVSGSHYKDMPMQPWEVMEAVLTPEEFIGYLKGNIVKYAMRAGKKAGSDDAGKAKHYQQKLAEVQRG